MSVSTYLLLAMSCVAGPEPPVSAAMSRLPEYKLTINTRHFLLPIRVNDEAVVAEIAGYVSTDEGRTWKLIGRIAPQDKGFEFHAESDGVYWFTLQIATKTGQQEPLEVGKGETQIQKILVDTRRQRTSAKVSDAGIAHKMPYAD